MHCHPLFMLFCQTCAMSSFCVHKFHSFKRINPQLLCSLGEKAGDVIINFKSNYFLRLAKKKTVTWFVTSYKSTIFFARMFWHFLTENTTDLYSFDNNCASSLQSSPIVSLCHRNGAKSIDSPDWKELDIPFYHELKMNVQFVVLKFGEKSQRKVSTRLKLFNFEQAMNQACNSLGGSLEKMGLFYI